MAENTALLKIKAIADVQGLEFAGRSLKALNAAIGPADRKLDLLRRSINEVSQSSKVSESVIKAQINALTNLRTRAELGGETYKALTADIQGLKVSLEGTTTSLTSAATAVDKVSKALSRGDAAKQYYQAIRQYKEELASTEKVVGLLTGSIDANFKKTGQSADFLQRQIQQLKQAAATTGNLLKTPESLNAGQIANKGRNDIQAFIALVKRLQEQTQTATGKVARLSEGMFSLAATGKVVGGVTASLGGVAAAAEKVSSFTAQLSARFAEMGAGTPQYLGPLKSALNEISLLINQPANGMGNFVQSLQGAKSAISAANVPLEAFNSALTAIGPEGALVAGGLAAAFAGLQDSITRAFRAGEKEASEALQGISDETQKLLVKLAELSEVMQRAASMNELQSLRSGGMSRFNDVAAGTDASRRAANTIANAEYRIKAEQQAQAQVLEAARQRYRGTTESVDALSERLAYLQTAMKLVDQSTTEGKVEFASFASEADQLKRRIDSLGNSYRTVADAIRDAAQAQGQYANQSTVSNYFNRAAVRRQEEIATATREQLARPQTPLLPAAGQTSFTGEVRPSGLGGGARMGTSGSLSRGGVAETPFIFGTEKVGSATAIYRGQDRSAMEVAAAMAALGREAKGAATAVNGTEQQIKELQQAAQGLGAVNKVFADMGVAARGSINGLQAQRKYWEDLRNAVDTTSGDFRRASRELDVLDRKLERHNRNGGGLNRLGQTIGAISASSVFGGPEGLVGAGMGAFFGPGGALAGGAAGAQLGQFRQQLGQFSTYSADIEKQRIALKGVTGSLEEYQKALAATAGVSKAFNIPQLEATQQMTRLSAAVIGAGGKVADAEVVFRNISAAIKASGGSAEDVTGAVTALTQVFSKGKLSAEEINQIAERLPGTFTMIAKAANMTGPELSKALEQGTVGLDTLMKFIVSPEGLGKFESTAKQISQSSADAGARLVTTFNDTKEAIGKAIAPIGAQIQDSLAKALKEATPALTEFAKGVASLIKLIADNAGLIGNLAKLALTFGGVTLAMKALAAVQGPLAQGMALLGASIGRSSAQAVVAQQRLAAFGTTVGTLAQSLAAPIIITVAIVGVQVVIDWLNKVKQAQDRVKAAQSGLKGESWVQSIGGNAQSMQELTRQVNAAGKSYQVAQDNIKAFKKELETTKLKPRQEFLRQQITAQEAVRDLAQSRYRAGIDAMANRFGRPAADPLAGLTNFLSPAGKDDGKAAKKAAEEAKRSQIDSLNLNLENLKTKEESEKVGQSELDQLKTAAKYQEQRLGIQMQLIRLQYEDKKLRDQAVKNLDDDNKLLGKQAAEKRKDVIAKISNIGVNMQDVIDKFTQRVDRTENPIELEIQSINNRITEARQNLDQLKDELMKQGGTGDVKPELGIYQSGTNLLGSYTPERVLSEATANAVAKDQKSLEDQIAVLRRMGVELSSLDQLRQKYGDGWNQLDAAQRSHLEALAAQKDALEENARLVEGIVNPLGNGLTNAFDLLIQGTENWGNSLRQIASGVLIDIAKQLMQIFVVEQAIQMIKGVIGGLFPGPKTAAPRLNITDALKYSANGNVFARNGIQPFAMGGIVDKPTMFRFAKGTGLMGEAGPEAIMPLKRGADGKLGVAGGGGVQVGSINITVENKGQQLDPAAQKQIASQVQGIVLATLVNQKRSGGIL